MANTRPIKDAKGTKNSKLNTMEMMGNIFMVHL